MTRFWRAAAVVALCGLSTAASARSSEISLRDRQQAACYDDAQRLCGDAVPDVAKTEACMKTKRAQVSKKCSDMYDVKK